MHVAVTGASGFIGSALCSAAAARGWRVTALGRDYNPSLLESLDAVIHLAGESVAGRWTNEKKTQIERSRVEGTRRLVQAIAACERKPRVLVSASAVGYYGDRGDEPLFEESAPGNDFLARVCTGWEREAAAAQALGVRTVMLRTGIVLGAHGGALAQMMKPFRFGAGGPLGSGRQFVAWIDLEDIVALYLFAVENEALRGPVNAVTPDYATNARLAQAMGSAMRRPALAPAPGIALRALLGEFAGTLLGSQLVIPDVAQNAGFRWRRPRLEDALQSILDPSRETALLRTFTASQIVAAPLERVFAFFSDAANLQAITPPSLSFRMKRAPERLSAGSVIDYSLRVHGIPFKWKTLIARWEPQRRFVDVQLRGPYALWEHEHTFEEVAGGVRIADRVTYALPFAPFGAAAGSFVRNDVERIFQFRSRIIAERFQ